MEVKKRAKNVLKMLGCVLLVVIVILAGSIAYLMLGKSVDGASSEPTSGDEGTRSLVVYFSRSDVIETDEDTDATTSASLNKVDDHLEGNTEMIAKKIQEKTGADMYSIQTKRYYRPSFMGTAARAWIKETFDMRPALTAMPKNLDNYDVIYVGYPIWWFSAPMAVGTFMENYDLSDKTIIPFATSEDNSADISMDYMKKVCKDATVLDGYTANDVSDEAIEQWLQSVGVTQE